MSNLKLLYGSFHSSLVASSFSSTCLFSSRSRLLSFIWDAGIANLSEIPRASGLRTRVSFRNLWRKKRKSCRNFYEFKREVKSSDLMIVYLLAFAFSSLFVFWVLQAFPILIYHHLFLVNTLRAFKKRLVKRISVFRLCMFFHCDITKEQPRVQLSANHGDGSATVVCLCFDWFRWPVKKGEAAWQKRIRSNIIFYNTARQLKEQTPSLTLLTKH